MEEVPFTFSTDKSKLDPSVIHAFLTESYWSKGCSMDNILRRIENALCFGIYENNKQIGFARVITDSKRVTKLTVLVFSLSFFLDVIKKSFSKLNYETSMRLLYPPSVW